MVHRFRSSRQLTLPEIGPDKRESGEQRTSITITPAVKKALTIRTVEDGYGMRGKSRWIADAAEAFLANPYWKPGVLEVQGVREKTVTDSITLRMETWVKLWRAAIEVALYGAEQDPPEYHEISVSLIVRAAIVWRLGQGK